MMFGAFLAPNSFGNLWLFGSCTFVIIADKCTLRLHKAAFDDVRLRWISQHFRGWTDHRLRREGDLN